MAYEDTWEELSSHEGHGSDLPPISKTNVRTGTPASAAGSRTPRLDYRWYRVWTLPVYAGMYLVHSRYRALRPRRLPTLTSLRLPEIYGILALGDIAGYEAEHLRDDELDGNRRSIEACSEFLHMLFHERRYEVEAGYPDLTRNALPRRQDGTVSLTSEIQWRVRTWRTDEYYRTLVSHRLEDLVAACGLSDHDAAVLVTFLAERVKTGPDFEEDASALEGKTVWVAALTTALRATHSLSSSVFGLSAKHPGWLAAPLAINGMQRAALYALAYRAWSWKYLHYESLWDLDEPEKAAEVATRERRRLEDVLRRFMLARERGVDPWSMP